MPSSSSGFISQNQFPSTYVPPLGAFPSIHSLDLTAATAQPGYPFYNPVI